MSCFVLFDTDSHANLTHHVDYQHGVIPTIIHKEDDDADDDDDDDDDDNDHDA